MVIKSAGAVLFREKNGKREYLLLKYKNKKEYWGLAKGMIEEGEDEKKAALREIYEETGLEKVKLIDGFIEKSKFYYTWDGETVEKHVVWFLGEVKDLYDGSVSDEHEEIVWLTFKKLINKVTYKNDLEIVKKAELFLKD